MKAAALIIFIIVILYWLSKSGNRKKDIDDKKLTLLQQRTAKLPEVFSELMKEEYPEHRNSITQSKVSDIINSHASFWKSDKARTLYKSNPSGLIMEDHDFENAESRNKYLSLIANHLGAIISNEFKELVIRDPESFYDTLRRLYSTSNLKMDSSVGSFSRFEK